MECLIGGRRGIKRITGLNALEDGMFYGQLMFCHQRNFLVIIRRNDTQGTALYGYEYQGIVLLIGPPEEAENFIYRFVTSEILTVCRSRCVLPSRVAD